MCVCVCVCVCVCKLYVYKDTTWPCVKKCFAPPPPPPLKHNCGLSHLSSVSLAQRRLIQEVTKDPTTTSKELQASLASVKVSVHDSTIRKRLGKNGLHGRVPRPKPLLSKKNIKAHLSFARKHLDYPQDFWENTLWTDETKVEHLEGVCPITSGVKVTQHFRKRTSYQQ